MLFAVLIDSNLVKASGFWKAVLYLSSLTSVVISGILFRLMFTEYPTSQMNKLLVFFGQEPMAWLKNGTTAMFALLLLACWRWTGVNMLYFLSGLKGIFPIHWRRQSLQIHRGRYQFPLIRKGSKAYLPRSTANRPKAVAQT